MTGIENIGQFKAGLREEGAEIDVLCGRVSRRISLGILGRVIRSTPVDTGRARGNWQAGVNAIPAEAIDREDKSGGSALADGAGIIQASQPYSQIYLVNNVPYIGRLNAGWSKQAPAGFVEASIDAELAPFL